MILQALLVSLARKADCKSFILSRETTTVCSKSHWPSHQWFLLCTRCRYWVFWILETVSGPRLWLSKKRIKTVNRQIEDLKWTSPTRYTQEQRIEIQDNYLYVIMPLLSRQLTSREKLDREDRVWRSAMIRGGTATMEALIRFSRRNLGSRVSGTKFIQITLQLSGITNLLLNFHWLPCSPSRNFSAI